MTAKPLYRVPSMEEIRALPWNGFNAVSTFSGCGGSSLGYRMAGFRMLWASEFVPAAQETYRANAAPYTVLDTRDIREVTGQDILTATGLGVGEIDLFDGSPPCASFSTAGKREAGWGSVKKYSDTKQRTDDLFFEYARLIEQTRPRVFVAENVAGLVKGTAKGYFKEILARLKQCGYRVQARVLDASWLGVPQARQRLILVGVRDDLGMDPAHPAPLPYQYTVRDALPWILAQGDNGGFGEGAMRAADQPSPTIGATPATGNNRFPPSRVIVEPRFIHDTSGQPQFSMGDITDRASATLKLRPNDFQIHGEAEPVTHDPETGQALSIKGYAVHEEWRKLRPGEKSDKYFHVRRQHLDQPYETVMARQGDGPSFTGPNHWVEARKLTLGELRAIGGFPADFALTGSYAQRWERIGRAVPPVMMSHIAATVRDRILLPLREAGTI
ncbi:DNA cytosine methyltransferase [Streptomyces sp. NPDC001781]